MGMKENFLTAPAIVLSIVFIHRMGHLSNKSCCYELGTKVVKKVLLK